MPDLIQADEVVKTVGSAVGHEKAMECDGKPRLSERLDRLGLTEDAGASRDQHMLPTVGVQRVRHEAVDRRRDTAIQAICESRVDDRAFEDAMERASGADWLRLSRPCRRPSRLRSLCVGRIWRVR